MKDIELLFTHALRNAGIPRRVRITPRANHVRVPREGRCVYLNPRYLSKPPALVVEHVQEMVDHVEHELIPPKEETKTPFIKIQHDCALCHEDADYKVNGPPVQSPVYVCTPCWKDNAHEFKSVGLSRHTFPRVRISR